MTTQNTTTTTTTTTALTTLITYVKLSTAQEHQAAQIWDALSQLDDYGIPAPREASLICYLITPEEIEAIFASL